MHRKSLALTIIALSSWPVQEIAFLLPHRLEFPFVVSVLCALVMGWLWSTSAPVAAVAASEMESKTLVSMLRVVATKHAQKYGLVTADDLREAAEAAGVVIPAGIFPKVFRAPMFREVTKVRSSNPRNHGRPIGAYALGEMA